MRENGDELTPRERIRRIMEAVRLKKKAKFKPGRRRPCPKDHPYKTGLLSLPKLKKRSKG